MYWNFINITYDIFEKISGNLFLLIFDLRVIGISHQAWRNKLSATRMSLYNIVLID